MNVQQILEHSAAEGASDIFFVAGLPYSCRIKGSIRRLGAERLLPEDTAELISQIYALADNRPLSQLQQKGDDDFSFAIKGISRFRVNAFKQRGSYAAVIRFIAFDLPDPEKLGIPKSVIGATKYSNGLVLITGPAGSGKSTTLACMVDSINRTQEKHIITLEDPLEYLHPHKMSIVSQREVHADTDSYVSALRSALRQSPDVILLGEMRDAETTTVAMTAAETGHLILSTLHTIGAANTIDRIIDVFPPAQQRQIAVQLSMGLQAVVSQQLVPTVDGHLTPAFEIMTMTPAIRNMIRENKVHQIDGMLYALSNDDMMSMDSCLLRLYKEKKIKKETALAYATNPEMLNRKL